ncbi:MAG: hypothetical protein ACRC35_02580 [Angustibacter sp.]
MGRHREPGRRRASRSRRRSSPAAGQASTSGSGLSAAGSSGFAGTIGTAGVDIVPRSAPPPAPRRHVRELLAWGSFAGVVAGIAIVATGNSWRIAGAVLLAGSLTVAVVAVATAVSGGRRRTPRA